MLLVSDPSIFLTVQVKVLPSTGPLTMSTLSYVDAALLVTLCTMLWVCPSIVSGCPSLVQVTVVAGEPVVVQFRVENEPKDADVDDTIVGRAGGRHTVEIIIQRAYHHMPFSRSLALFCGTLWLLQQPC